MTRILVAAAWGVACLTVWAAPVLARPDARRVLLLYSYEREFSHFTFARLLRPELARSSPAPIDFIEISLQTVRASRDESDGAIVADLRSTLGSRPLDLVVTMGGPSASFTQKYKRELFPDTPVLITAVDSRFLASGPLPDGATAVTVRHDPRLVLEHMLRMVPDLQTALVVIGASRVEQFWLQEVRQAFRPFEPRLTFLWTHELSSAELLKRSGSLPPRSAIFYGIWSLDAAGVPQMEDQTLDALRQAANAPMFGLHSHQLGHGIVGGPLLSLEDLSRESAAVALRLLRGEPAAGIPPRTLAAGTPVFDGRELRRWGIADSRLPAGSVIRFQEPGTWQLHGGPITVGIVVAGAQAVLLIALTITSSKQRRLAAASLADVAAGEAALARLTRRLLQAHEDERASIAGAIHDDVCQQMTALTLALHGLAHERGGGAELRPRLERLCSQFWSLERDIVAISDPVYHRLDLLGLEASARALCTRRCLEAGVTLDFGAVDIPARLDRDVSLTLFRVLEEALDNALTHARTDHVRVSLFRTGGAIHLEVADSGQGFDADAAMKRGALGLIGMRERLNLAGGTCAIQSRPGAGTVVSARVPPGPVAM